MGTGFGARGLRGLWPQWLKRCLRLAYDHPKSCGVVTGVVSLAAVAAAMVLGEFGAPGVVFILLGLWLFTLGLPTVLATVVVMSLAPDAPVGPLPLALSLAAVVAASLAAQIFAFFAGARLAHRVAQRLQRA
jgi:hypothetical protein